MTAVDKNAVGKLVLVILFVGGVQKFYWSSSKIFNMTTVVFFICTWLVLKPSTALSSEDAVNTNGQYYGRSPVSSLPLTIFGQVPTLIFHPGSQEMRKKKNQVLGEISIVYNFVTSFRRGKKKSPNKALYSRWWTEALFSTRESKDWTSHVMHLFWQQGAWILQFRNPTISGECQRSILMT